MESVLTSDKWMELTSTAFASADVEIPTRGFLGRMSTQQLGPVSVSRVEVGRHRLIRTDRHVHDSFRTGLVLGLQVRGHAAIVQHGRTAELGPGDIALYDMNEPYEILSEGAMACIGIRIPMAVLSLPEVSTSELTARNVGSVNPFTTPLVETVRAVSDSRSAAPGIREEVAAHALGDLVSLLYQYEATSRGLLEKADEGLDLVESALAYARANLGDATLNAEEVANACHVSVRTLYRAMAARDIKLSEWVRRRRLEKAAGMLADAELAQITVAQVGARCGFSSAAHFSTAFREEFDLSPGMYRSAATGG